MRVNRIEVPAKVIITMLKPPKDEDRLAEVILMVEQAINSIGTINKETDKIGIRIHIDGLIDEVSVSTNHKL